ncbi:hypothetical protein Esi_0094_0022 [Ectocarpus siliculosus]|uniref:Uncharacterized protein n=1 Tax=Ectocarpus siliculosus TaxID=2880 RepID=D7G8Z9_ECTSI|nr:hypothetical protein Esi_0094_0022 [Ectocarpus siliculosus]|eukprot:CBJ28160.1 hypothetical protein Esi_0094_0022 [Ectocarpus siliculosus]
MAEEKPMTVKERMAALARASGQSSAAPAPVPRASGAATGPSVAERLAKMRAGPADAPTGDAPRLVRTLTPHPGAPTVVTSMPGGAGDSSKSGGSSSVADRIASLSGSGSGKPSILPPSPSGRPAGSSVSPAAGKTSQHGEGEVSAPAEAPAASKLSPGLAARLNAMRSSTDYVPEGEEGEEEEETPPPPPALATSGSSSSFSKVSPGLAARMGKAFPIPMPGGEQPC